MDLLSIYVAEQDSIGKYNKIQNKLTFAVQAPFLLTSDKQCRSQEFMGMDGVYGNSFKK